MSSLRVLMLPSLESSQEDPSGIGAVVRAYHRHLPEFGIELVTPNTTSYDVKAVHAGLAGGDCTVFHCHGLYWTADYDMSRWAYEANVKVIGAIRQAREVTVPSEWVAETFRRDMRFTPHIIPHGIEWSDWQHGAPSGGYVLWNKNRIGDVCNPEAVGVLAEAFPDIRFVTTFAPERSPDNMTEIGTCPPNEMKKIVQSAGVYLASSKETFGIGILEAMASGVPVLGFAHGGILGLIEHGVSGYLVAPGDWEGLAEGLTYCLEHRETLGANGRELARTWTWEAACEQVVEVYKLALVEKLPTVSVVIPSFMYADRVEVALTSAMAQTYELVESIIVVDDGSEDDGATERVVKALAENDNRVIYYRQPNRGVAIARNTGIAMTNSKYCCCLDADDWIEPGYLSGLVPALEDDHNLGVAYGGMKLLELDGRLLDTQWPRECSFDWQFRGRNQVPTCCVFRREVWTQLGGYRQRYADDGGGEDAEFWLRAGAAGWDMRQVSSKPLFIHTRGGHYEGRREKDWTSWHPWCQDGLHPFASIATPKRLSHPVRQYDEPLISVVIPVGPGHEREVINALDSLEAQTFRQWEVVVVNDTIYKYGSSLIGELKKSYPFIRPWIIGERQKPGGAGYARNRGAEIVRAPLLFFLDADDWLQPTALEQMLSEYSSWDHEIGVYSDCIGKVIITPETAAEWFQDPHKSSRIQSYDERTQKLTFRNHTLNYNWDRAIRQPDPAEPYVWNFISTLIPTSWHLEVGGFDEQMPSWEDWDYWLRLARLGKCFVRIPEPLMMYQFHTGNRSALAFPDTDKGLQIAQDLVQYMREKYAAGGDPVACPGCGRRRSVSRSRRKARMPTINPGISNTRSDEDMIEVLYSSPNKGEHSVYGLSTKHFYGYRCSGDRFLVWREDVFDAEGREIAPHFEPIDMRREAAIAVPRRPGIRPAPPPPRLVKTAQKMAAGVVVPSKAVLEAGESSEETVAETSRNVLDFDIGAAPGLGTAAARKLRDAGFATVGAVLEAGKAKLEGISGIGAVTAARITETLTALQESW